MSRFRIGIFARRSTSHDATHAIPEACELSDERNRRRRMLGPRTRYCAIEGRISMRRARALRPRLPVTPALNISATPTARDALPPGDDVARDPSPLLKQVLL